MRRTMGFLLICLAAIALALPAGAQVLSGLDVLLRDGCKPLIGKRIGLITNHTAVDAKGRHILDLLVARPEVKLVALFAPEHGIRGDKDEIVKDGVDQKTGLKVTSLYGTRYRPTPESLDGIDLLVFDIQDIGVRYYTYPCTMKYCMQEAAKKKIPFLVLDRPNPITGRDMDGPTMDTKYMGFASWAEVPTRHGMTMGELAQYFNSHFDMKLDLTVVKCEGWKRDMWYDKTGLPWVNLSPNIRNLNEALLYAGIGCLEVTNMSVGRGTDTPFEVFGAPWIDGEFLAKELNARKITGLKFEPTQFTPKNRELRGQLCKGVKITITDRDKLHITAATVEIADVLYRKYGDQFVIRAFRGMFGKPTIQEGLIAGKSVKEIVDGWNADLTSFGKERKKFLLYD